MNLFHSMCALLTTACLLTIVLLCGQKSISTESETLIIGGQVLDDCTDFVSGDNWCAFKDANGNRACEAKYQTVSPTDRPKNAKDVTTAEVCQAQDLACPNAIDGADDYDTNCNNVSPIL